MASYISTEQYVWGLHRLLDGITTANVQDNGNRATDS